MQNSPRTERPKVKHPVSKGQRLAVRGAIVQPTVPKVRATFSLAVNLTYSTQVVHANTPVVPCNTPYHYSLKMVCWISTTFLTVLPCVSPLLTVLLGNVH